MTHNQDPSRKISNRARRATKVLAALSPLLLAAACSTSPDKPSANSIPRPTAAVAPETTTTVPEVTTTTISKEQQVKNEAVAYASSEQRNAAIKETVTNAGTRIVELATSGEVGYFDFYNFTTGEWGRGADNEGYGYLQHNPQYGGTDAQIMVAIYQKADGSLDLSKIKGVNIHTPNEVAVGFESPDYASTMLDSTDVSPSWESEYIPTHADKQLDIAGARRGSVYYAENSDVPADELRLIDSSAITALNDQLSRIG